MEENIIIDKHLFVIEYDKKDGIKLVGFNHLQFLQYSLGNSDCIIADNPKTLFYDFFRYYDNYKNHNNHNAPFFTGVDGEKNKLFFKTALRMKLPVKEMMVEIENLYNQLIEDNPELFI